MTIFNEFNCDSVFRRIDARMERVCRCQCVRRHSNGLRTTLLVQRGMSNALARTRSNSLGSRCLRPIVQEWSWF